MERDLKLLKKIRKERECKYSDIAEMLNCSKPFAWQLVNSHRKVSYEMAILIAEIFNMKPDELFYCDYINSKETKDKLNRINEIKRNQK